MRTTTGFTIQGKDSIPANQKRKGKKTPVLQDKRDPVVYIFVIEMAKMVLFLASVVSVIGQGLLAQYEWVMKELCV